MRKIEFGLVCLSNFDLLRIKIRVENEEEEN